MKILYLLVFSIIPGCLLSQTLSPSSIFCATGNYKKEGYAQISWTIGDLQVKTYKSPDETLVLTQGFIQNKFTITSIYQKKKGNLNIKFFPNPVKDILHIEWQNEKQFPIEIELFSLDGKILTSKILNPTDSNTEIDFNSFQHGIYILKAKSNKESIIQSYKILYEGSR